MLDGFFKDNSKDLGRLQILLDPLIISALFNYSYSNNIDYNEYQNTKIIVFLITYLFLSWGTLYKSYRNKSILMILLSVIKVWLFLFLFFLSLDYLFLNSIFIGSFFNWSLLSLIFLLINHAGLRFLLRLLRKVGKNSRNYIFWGSLEALNSLKLQTRNNLWMGFLVFTFYIEYWWFN